MRTKKNVEQAEMQSNSILVEILFYSKEKRCLPCVNYRPHFVIPGSDYYMGISFSEFFDGPAFDMKIHAVAKFVYNGVDYSSLKVGAQFEIREGARTVGKGEVLKRIIS